MTFSARIHCNGCDMSVEAHAYDEIPEDWSRIDVRNDGHVIIAQWHLCPGCDQLADPDSLSAVIQVDRALVVAAVKAEEREQQRNGHKKA